MIKGYAYQNDYGRNVHLNVGYHRIWGHQEIFQPYVFENGQARLAEEQSVEMGAEPVGGLDIPFELAEEMYRALDRIFGKRDETPAVVKDCLTREQARVDKMIDSLIGYLNT